MDKPHERHRLLFLIPSLQGGGAERVVLTLLRHLSSERFDLALAVIDGRCPAYFEDLPPNVAYFDLQSSRVRYSLLRILRLVWSRRPKVIFSTLGHLNLALALLKPLLPRGTRLVARETAVVSDMLRAQRGGAVWSLAYKRLSGRFDKVICQSYSMRNELVSRFGYEARNTVVIHNPIDIDRIRRLAVEPLPTSIGGRWLGNGDQITLVAAGRLSHEKGFDLLIEAIALTANPQLRLVILGQGPLREPLENLATRLHVSDRVDFIGFDANPYRYFARASAVVLSSRSEAFPNVVLEALACGAPVIATPASGGVQEILEGRHACLICEDISAQSLASAISSYPFATAAPQTRPDVSEFSAALICALYANVLSGIASCKA